MKHDWIKLTRQSVDVIVDLEGQPFVVSRPGEPIGEGIGCDNCDQPLNTQTILQPCEPVAVISL